MSFIDDLKYEFDHFSETLTTNDYDNYKQQLIEFKEYKDKIIAGKFTLDEYTNLVENYNGTKQFKYFTCLVERAKPDFFGSIRGGTSYMYNIYKSTKTLNPDNYFLTDEQYIIDNNLGIGNYIPKIGLEVDPTIANAYFGSNILPLLKNILDTNFNIVGGTNYDSFVNLDEYVNYKGKKVVVKIASIDARISKNKYPLVGIYTEDNVDYLLELLEVDGTGLNLFEKNRLCQEKILRELGINSGNLNDYLKPNGTGYDLNTTRVYLDYKIYKSTWRTFTNYEAKAKNDANPIYKKIDAAVKKNKQIILTGAPGTGKTYSAEMYVESKIGTSTNRKKFVQFHQSYDYSDFVEGLKPVILKGSSKPTFVKIDGIFKEFCREIVEQNYLECIKATTSFEEIKDFNSDKYNDENLDNYYLIIDEINRADLSKVFGELMFGLEESYRGINNSFKTQYSELDTYKVDDKGIANRINCDVFKNGFFIPNNLIIIGTMNDIDKSVESFDFAMRRRFQWIKIFANDVLDQALKSMIDYSLNAKAMITLIKNIKNMNEYISKDEFKFGLDENYQIGHAYFKNVNIDDNLSMTESLTNIFEHKIKPLLREYTRGRSKDDVDKFVKTCYDKLLGKIK